MRFFQKQVDIIRKETKDYLREIAFVVLLMLVAIHYIDQEGWQLIPKIILSLLIIGSVSVIYHKN